jgi:hypothetical protein
MTDLMLANVEALAQGEGQDSYCRMNMITWYCNTVYGYACYCE